MLRLLQKAEHDEDARMELETYVKKYQLGDVPVPDGEAAKALQTYNRFHNQRTHDFPYAYAAIWESVEIVVDDEQWIDFYLSAWDMIHGVLNEVKEAKRKRESS